jgi:hypothetical protein
MAIFVRSGLPMAERLISTLSIEQCEHVAEFVERAAAQLHDERARYYDDGRA